MTGVYFNPNMATQSYLNFSGAADMMGNFDSASYMDADIGSYLLGTNPGGMSFGGACGNSQLMRNQEEMEDWQINRQVNLKKKSEKAEFESNSRDKVVSRKIGLLQSAILDNKQDSVHKIYNELLAQERKRLNEIGCDEPDEEEVKANVEEAYFNRTGSSLIEDLRTHGEGEFVNGFKKGAFLGLGSLLMDKRSKEDNLREITGEEKTNADGIKKWTGIVLSGALAAGAILLLGKAGLAIKAAKVAKAAM